MKKALSIALVLALALTLFAGCGGAASSAAVSSAPASSVAQPAAEGKVLNIYCWNGEFQSRVEAYYPDYNKDTQMIGDVKVNWIVTPSDNNAYQNALDEALLGQSSAAEDDKVDLFLIEADYALKYTDGEAGVAMSMADIGITDADLADQFQYTKDVVSDANGVQRGISWQGCPGVMLYRRDVAKEVLGTDDPAKVQEAVSDWDKFDATAATMSKSGYKMLPGFDDTYRVFSNNVSAPWVTDNKITVDPAITKWVEQTKAYTENGYNEKGNLWSSEWSAGATGKAFCYFGPAWFIDFCLAGYTMETSADNGGKAEAGNGTWGNWAACAGPQGYFWGGTWMCAATGTDNTTLIADLMKTMCCSADTATALAKDVNEFANNKTAMKALAQDTTYGSAFLGGQNVYQAMYNSAESIKMDKITAYDQGLNESFQTAYHDYFNGTVDADTAYANFLKTAQEKYPELKS